MAANDQRLHFPRKADDNQLCDAEECNNQDSMFMY